MIAKTMALALTTLAGTAIAQPASFTDLGNRTTTQTFTQDVTLLAANDVQWFRLDLPPVSAAGGWVDIWTAAVGDITDTEIGLYDSMGAGATAAYNDDDSGPNFFSQLTFGSTVARTNLGGGALARNGSDGELVGGEYYLAVARYSVAFATGFTVTSTYTGAQRTTQLNFDIFSPTDPYPPTAVGAVDFASATPGSPVLFTVTVTPGGNPASTGLAVVGDLTEIGGSATQAFFDDGSNGDAAAGDNIFSYSYTLPANAPGGLYSVAVAVSDAQTRTANTTITGNVFNPTDLGVVGSETTVTHSLSFAAPEEIQWLRFTTLADCDPVTNFLDIDTEGSTLTGTGSNPNDTEIGLFSEAGALIASDDDSGSGALSQLTFGATGNPRPAVGNGLAYTGTDGASGANVPAGNYYLAVGIFNVNFAANLSAVHTASTITTGSNGTIVVNFNGNLPGGGSACGPADIGQTGGVPGADNHLDNNDFVVYIDTFFAHAPSADIGVTGGIPGSDGVWDNNDFVVYIDQFFNAPAACRS